MPAAPSAATMAPSARYRFMLPSPAVLGASAPVGRLLVRFDLDLDADLRALLVRAGEAEDQRARALRVLQRDLEAALGGDPRTGLGDGPPSDLVEQLHLGALGRRDAAAVDDAGQPALEAVALAVPEHDDGPGGPHRLLPQRDRQARLAAARGLTASGPIVAAG